MGTQRGRHADHEIEAAGKCHFVSNIAPRMQRERIMRLLLAALVGALFGIAVSSIPSPQEPSRFWIGNLSTPWALLAFAAGWLERTQRGAVAAGAVALIGCVSGFYGRFLLLTSAPSLGMPPGSAWPLVALTGLVHWVSFTAPWMVAAVIAGGAFGYLGRRWGESRLRLAGAAVGASFLIEPLAWWLYSGAVKDPLILWGIELLIGIAVLWIVALTPEASRPMRG